MMISAIFLINIPTHLIGGVLPLVTREPFTLVVPQTTPTPFLVERRILMTVVPKEYDAFPPAVLVHFDARPM